MPAKSHGHTCDGKMSLTFNSWRGMMERCRNPSNKAFVRYGGAGIEVCERWLKFENFLADMKERPSKSYTLDRFPNASGNYEINNCRWATWREQRLNRKSTRPIKCSDGRVFASIVEAAEATGGTRQRIQAVCVRRGGRRTYHGLGWDYA